MGVLRLAVTVAAVVSSFVIANPALGIEAPKPAIGSKVGDVSFRDVRYLDRSLSDLGESKAIVLIFTSTTCPVVKRYLPRLAELDKEFAPQGVQFVAVNVAEDDSITAMSWQAIEFGIEFPFVKDVDGEVMQAVGAVRTPEVVVLNAAHEIVYRGRIDDQYRVSGVQPNVTRHDLREALTEVLAGKAVSISETQVDGCTITPFEPIAKNPELTFAKDIAPIINKHCVECHRPGTEAPFALTSFEQVSGKAGMISEVVKVGLMPPWFAHPGYGEWLNKRGMTEDEKRTLLQWAKSGRAPGDLSTAPALPTFPEDVWLIGEPDIVLEAETEDEIPADGVIPYVYQTLPYVFAEDTWVQGIQIQPTNTTVVHHANVVYTIGDKGYKEDENFLTGRVPGGAPAIMTNGVAMLIPKGAVLTVQIHYVTTGKPQKSKMRVGLRYAKEVIHKRARHKVLGTHDFAIPAQAAAHPVSASKELECDATGVALFVHMHLRGKNSVFVAKYPDGTEETLLAIPNYRFDWQMPYLFPVGQKKFPKGTKVVCRSQFDNSAFNAYNPDPKVEVKYGPQTYEEMMDGYMFYLDDAEDLNLQVDPSTGHAITRTAAAE